MKLTPFYEFKRGAFTPIKSFKIQDELNPKIWDKFDINSDVRKQLIQIGKDFFEGTDIDSQLEDIVFCGSLCNYNWSEKYSDFDLHIIINFEDVDENYELVEKACDYAKKVWNLQHGIKIKGYDVEVAIQDSNDLKEGIRTGRMGGVFSLTKNKWVKRPEKVEFRPDEKTIKEKSKTVMMIIDDIEQESKEKDYEQLESKITKVWKKIKKYRQSGLESEDTEFSIGNLIFKLLRRNGYIDRLMKVKRVLYDKQFK